MTNNYSVFRNIDISTDYTAVVAMSVYKNDTPFWLEQACYSVLDQSLKDIMLVLVIDGEVSPAILQSINNICSTNNNVVVLKSSLNRGLSASMNAVVNFILKSDLHIKYFARMDADDICEPERLSKQISFLDNNHDISVLGTGLFEVNESGRKVGARVLPPEHSDIVAWLPKRCPMNHPTVVMRMNVFYDGFRYDETLRNTQDYFLWIDLASNGYKFANLKDKLLKFRRVNDFYKRRGLTRSLNEFKARFYAMRRLKKYSLGCVLHAFAVLALRLMPSKVVKLAYKLDRYILGKKVK